MKNLSLKTALLAGLVLWCATSPATAQMLDNIGVTLLRALTTNVNGTGIRVAQPEASAPTFEVNPATVGQPTNLFSYASTAGSADGFPNSVGTESGHADGVGNAFYGNPGGVATNVTHVDNYDADYFLNTYVFVPTPAPAVDVVNQSYTFGVLSVADQQGVDSAYDDYIDAYGTCFVSAACNAGISAVVCAPGTDYNCISVGAYQNGGFYNSIGPTPDNGRCKPDITAISTATSFSTPQVAGVAAVLLQAARRGDGGSDTNAAGDLRTIKALLLNGAVKPIGWTNGSATPLDARHGAGVVNAFNSYQQLAGGRQANTVITGASLGGAHPPVASATTIASLSGWNFATNTSHNFADITEHYYFNVTNGVAGAKFLATATLVWNRHQGQTNINDLNLFLYNCANSNLVACSTSRVDNVEHIHVTNLPAGRYDLQVWKAGGLPLVIVSAAEPYALAFEFVSPSLTLTRAGTNALLSWPAYPAGFRVETATNLVAPVWTTGSLPAAGVTNNSHRFLWLNATNAQQFFRLRQPDI